MWPSLDRTRRRLLGGSTEPAPPVPDARSDDPPDAPVASEIVLAIGRPEFDRLGMALQALLGPTVPRPDTPARLEAALASAVEVLGGDGRPRVTRRPAGLYTPEAWQVRLVAIEPAIGDAIRGAIRDGAFAA
ncbi:MAG TPA: hypothetical protein VD763_07620 [Candidatus Saccharimonadales bacterium]|nr:hypothetical protein [Candidatus Saccharimonadales bacterium]